MPGMLCARCGQELPDIAQFCLKCGLPVAVRAPAPAPAAQEAFTPTKLAAAPHRPYVWGRLQGWGLILLPPLVAVFSLIEASSENDYNTALGAGIFSVLTVPMGIGILKRKQYGLILVYVTLGLICLWVVFGFVQSGLEGARGAAIGSPIWIYSTIYYHKRRGEFT